MSTIFSSSDDAGVRNRQQIPVAELILDDRSLFFHVAGI
jgi:hypothetical protein